ncbi:hypothetical protein DRZ78_04090 [Candidatus Aerophobetes bacterium]|uniref:Carboxypeptidase regulatory-like domain-containing protein n=1 Tax=Aerophobetes bacterium TaxID=2030807 RepID=A0A662D3F4_UNCAE|nr:MAG: hypothetical protein DRZ78_04090 [Candidatus Aerophobetes bacterium]
MRRTFLYIIIGVIIAVCLGIFFSIERAKYGEVEGKVVDELSGDAVRGVKIVLDGKSTTHYMSKTYRLTGIKPGSYTLKVTAPNYYDLNKDIFVKKGKNLVDISLKGKEIPDLKGIIIFTEPKNKGIEIEIRFTNSKGEGIVNYPCLPLTLEGKLFTRIGTEKKYIKGKKIFEGPIELFWDSKAYLAKNKAIIPWEKIHIDQKEKKYGILEVTLHTPQGDFKDTSDDVKLFKEE